MTHLTSITHSSSSSKEQSTSSFATDRSLYLTSLGRSAGLYNKNQNFCIFLACFMQISLFYVSSIFRCFSPVFLVSFVFLMDCQRNDEALGYCSCQITTAEGNCHWDGLWQGISVPWTAVENSFSCKAEFGRWVQALGVMRYTHLQMVICSGLAWPKAMFYACMHCEWDEVVERSGPPWQPPHLYIGWL